MPFHINKRLLFIFLLYPLLMQAQVDTLKETSLPDVVIKAYEQGKRWRDVPAAVNFVSKTVLERFGPTSIVQAINTTPGVRMEERSPGSYRFNIRGSSLRSPFGVRNVKVYYNDIPITDPGGHTYLNGLGYYNFNSIEIIKGPGSSLYGAGTGGVLVINGITGNEQRGAMVEYETGSYHLQNIYGSITTGKEKEVNRISFQHQQSGGFRDHSALKREVFSWDGVYRFGEEKTMRTTFLLGDLFYETPGALTFSEYNANPKSARPGNGSFPGAASAKASVTQRMFLAGLSYTQMLVPKWKNTTAVYGMFTELRNPTIQNYGRNSEPHAGGRTTFQFNQPIKSGNFLLDIGGEAQEGFANISIFKNAGGIADSLQTTDEVYNNKALLFAQAVLDVHNWSINASSSINFFKVRLQRFAPASLGKLSRTFNNEWAPRLALARKWNQVTFYTSVSKGFSPPTTAELAPTGGAINLALTAEEGWNYDFGIKGNLLPNLFADVNAFYFSLQNTIVQRRTAGGGDYFINAGKTKQYGVETYISYPLLQSLSMVKSLWWLSHTYHHFTYRSFKQLTSDFSGNYLPAEAKNTVSTGIDLLAKNGLSGVVSYYYSGKIPLNDANTAFAKAYNLVSIKAGYQWRIKNRYSIKTFAGIENLLDQKYSLGNDVNGFGGRYYNAAPARNYYAGFNVQWLAKS